MLSFVGNLRQLKDHPISRPHFENVIDSISTLNGFLAVSSFTFQFLHPLSGVSCALLSWRSWQRAWRKPEGTACCLSSFLTEGSDFFLLSSVVVETILCNSGSHANENFVVSPCHLCIYFGGRFFLGGIVIWINWMSDFMPGALIILPGPHGTLRKAGSAWGGEGPVFISAGHPFPGGRLSFFPGLSASLWSGEGGTLPISLFSPTGDPAGFLQSWCSPAYRRALARALSSAWIPLSLPLLPPLTSCSSMNVDVFFGEASLGLPNQVPLVHSHSSFSFTFSQYVMTCFAHLAGVFLTGV